MITYFRQVIFLRRLIFKNCFQQHHYIRKLPAPPLVVKIVYSYIWNLVNRLANLGYRKVDLYRLYEIFDWRERQSKYIMSSTKPYEFFGFKYALPLRDKRFIELWDCVPLKWRYRRYLYRLFLSRLFSYFDLDFERKSFRYLYEMLLSKSVIDTLLNIGFSPFKQLWLKRWYNPCGFDVFFPLMARVSKVRSNKIEYFKKSLNLESTTRCYAHIYDLTLNILSQHLSSSESSDFQGQSITERQLINALSKRVAKVYVFALEDVKVLMRSRGIKIPRNMTIIPVPVISLPFLPTIFMFIISYILALLLLILRPILKIDVIYVRYPPLATGILSFSSLAQRTIVKIASIIEDELRYKGLARLLAKEFSPLQIRSRY